MATFGDSAEKEGPCHFTGMTPWRVQDTRVSPSGVRASIVAVPRVTPSAISASHCATLALSGPTGRVNLTLEYLIRTGSLWTKPLLPPSIRSSVSTSIDSPSQVVKAPSLQLSISTVKYSPTSMSMSAMSSPSAQARKGTGPFPIEPQLPLQVGPDLRIQAAGQIVEVLRAAAGGLGAGGGGCRRGLGGVDGRRCVLQHSLGREHVGKGPALDFGLGHGGG